MTAPRFAAVLAALAVAGGVTMSVLAATKADTPNAEQLRVRAKLPKPEVLIEGAGRLGYCLQSAGDEYVFLDRAGKILKVKPEQAGLAVSLRRAHVPKEALVVVVAEELELGLLSRDDVAC